MKFGLYSSIANPPHGEHLERSIDEGRERRTHRRYVVWGDVARPDRQGGSA